MPIGHFDVSSERSNGHMYETQRRRNRRTSNPSSPNYVTVRLSFFRLCTGLLVLDFLYDIEDFAAAVISTSYANSMWRAKGATVGTLRKRRAFEGVVTSAVARVGSRVTHSYNHTREIVSNISKNARRRPKTAAGARKRVPKKLC